MVALTTSDVGMHLCVGSANSLKERVFQRTELLSNIKQKIQINKHNTHFFPKWLQVT